MHENKEIEDTKRRDLLAAAECLKSYLETHGGTGRPYEILQFLSNETLRRVAEGKSPQFNNVAIQSGVMGKGGRDASGWLSPLWKKITENILPSREDGLRDFARQRGLTTYPWVTKTESNGGAGNQTLYQLEARALPPIDSGAHFFDLPEPDIRYIPLENIRPVWWIKIFFDKELSVRGWRKILFQLYSPIFFMIFAILFGGSFWLTLSQVSTFTPQYAQFLILAGIFSWFAWVAFKRLEVLIEDRISMASDTLLGLKEFGVCLELASIPTEGNPRSSRFLRLVKYAGKCPICSSQVLLDKGEPDFPRRIVGRCQESPREHVFNFDRVTRAGFALRTAVLKN